MAEFEKGGIVEKMLAAERRKAAKAEEARKIAEQGAEAVRKYRADQNKSESEMTLREKLARRKKILDEQ